MQIAGATLSPVAVKPTAVEPRVAPVQRVEAVSKPVTDGEPHAQQNQPYSAPNVAAAKFVVGLTYSDAVAERARQAAGVALIRRLDLGQGGAVVASGTDLKFVVGINGRIEGVTAE